MSLTVAGQEGIHVGDRRILAEDLGYRADEGALTIGAGAVGEDERMLARVPAAAVST